MVTSIINLALPEDDVNRKIHIYGYQAESYTETPSTPNFDSIDIAGRSSPIAYYNGGSARSISFSMMFHRDLVSPWSSAIRYANQPAGLEIDPETDSKYTSMFLTDAVDDIHGASHETTDELILRYARAWSELNAARDVTDGKYVSRKRDAEASFWQISSNKIELPTGMYSWGLNDRGWEWWLKANEQAEANATARFHLFLNKLKALNYPVYTSAGIVPPKVYLKIGGDSNVEYIENADGGSMKDPRPIITTDGGIIGGLRLKGYCTTDFEYDGIVKYNSLISCTVNFNFTEVVDQAWSAPEIIDGMQRYVQWMEQSDRGQVSAESTTTAQSDVSLPGIHLTKVSESPVVGDVVKMRNEVYEYTDPNTKITTIYTFLRNVDTGAVISQTSRQKAPGISD